MNNFIFVTGGVLSSLGKGITAASIGTLLKSMGYSITFLKLDPYLNIDPGTMSPAQHGEVFVTEDGAETDLDLGHYERFAHTNLATNNCITAGKMYTHLLEKERKGVFLGATIQVVPHLTNEIKNHLYAVAADVDIAIVEIGGTVGDIESLPFLEAARQMRLERSRSHCIYVHLTYIPYMTAAGELKTKPTQHSIRELSSLGIQPDIIIGRSEKALPLEIKKKISLFTNVDEQSIFSSPDLTSIYQVPLYFHNEGLDKALIGYLNLPYKKPFLEEWTNFAGLVTALKKKTTIVIVGKYIELKDAYKSLCEALMHAQVATQIGVDIQWIDAQTLTLENCSELLGHAHGIVVPGGFGARGVEGKIAAAHYARKHKIPYLGICLGMQVVVIEFARHVLGLEGAHSTEFDPAATHPVIMLMPDQRDKEEKGATMRLGSFSCALAKNTRAYDLYKADVVFERHRHRYEVNPAFESSLQSRGLIISGVHKERNLTEIVEISSHPYFIGCQFHPEFKSKPFDPHPLFVSLIQAAFETAVSKE